MLKTLFILLIAYTVASGLGYISRAHGAELECMTMNLYHEARGEEAVGIIAVGQVVINRVNSKQFPNTVCDVVKQGGERLNRCQFSWWCDGRSDKAEDREAWHKMVFYAKLLLSRSELGDPSEGALFYHTVSVKPYWAPSRIKSATLGNHVFYQ